MATVSDEPGNLPDRTADVKAPAAPPAILPRQMPHCAHNGYLVDANRPLPIDPTEYDVAYLPTIGCSRLVCLRCQSVVRNAPGLAFKTRDDVAAATLSEMYDLPDLLDSNLIHRTTDAWRLYLCRCDRYLAIDETALEHDDPDDSPDKPWRCAGHPIATRPEQTIREWTRRGLRGETPPDTREMDRENNFWLLRLYHRLEPPLAATMAEVASESVADADPPVRSASLRLLFFTATDAMRELVVNLLKTRRELLAVPIDIGLHKLDTTLEDIAWHVVSKIVDRDGIARDHARGEALAGHGSRALYSALAEHDSDWLLANLEKVARSTPGRAADLISSFNYLPADRQSSDHAAKVRRWLIAPTAPLAWIRKAAKDHVMRVRRDVPLEGGMMPIRLPLPDLEDGTTLDLEITAPASTGRERLLDLHIRTPGGTAVRRLDHGTKIDLISRLQSKDIADRIVYLSLEVRQ